MIKINGQKVTFEGGADDLLTELARAIHEIAATMVEKSPKKVKYEAIIAELLQRIHSFKRVQEMSTSLPDDLIAAFMKRLEEEREKHGDSPDWIEIREGTFKTGFHGIKMEAGDHFFIDPRNAHEFEGFDQENDTEGKKKKDK